MPRRNHSDDQDGATESKFYPPAGVIPPFDAGRFERIRAALLDQQGEPLE